MSPATEGAPPLLQVRDLEVAFRVRGGEVLASRGVSLEVRAGETLGLVGESGSGKSVLCRAVLRLLPQPAAQVRVGQVLFDGADLLALPERRMRQVRGTDIAMVFQNPMTSLSPVWPIGDQLTEGLRVHRGLSRAAAREQGIALMRATGIPEPERRYDDHPWQWSGGMLQRAVIAMAMACKPRLLLADEPTTALDVTIQEQILALLADLQEASGMAMVLVSHDIGVVAETCDRIAVMYAGTVVETGPAAAVLGNPRHPYTLGLLRSSPGVDRAGRRLDPIPGQPPDLADPAPGCPFAERCALASAQCRENPVRLEDRAPGHASACLFPERMS
ncbi:MAG: ABC transporter ATP-binding protein [Betaproteobacteria bacterium]|jgi:oligopeptide/dipeptide ABC transporter ATP-binding protein|nr:ABC transporter ATP-binding protein [Rhodocyclaceae bacterium]MCA3135223.1 ABC transporter ATP-binding protein [Rhodocyclaceae bacterium]MCA3142722.1 ABC transporter ATP-binding protein [Rhodocyclaceae bacterium]MCA3145255.1 ABC transporter ATP-binding protein [Rhodocyclaceae bacterium]MCE2899371.1 ABC transporter ATP-binding protein [Betaproteobacteria bacterium]